MGAKIHFITNGIFTTSVAGGDLVFFNLARAAAAGGYEINYFGGHAFQQIAAQHQLPGTITLTDNCPLGKVKSGLSGQFGLLWDFYGRYRRTLQLQNTIAPEDFVCAASDYWFDVIPAVRCAARRKLMVLNMEAPTFGQIITRRRPDVDALRLASLHYWASQAWSLRRIAACRERHVFYMHPLMEKSLDRLGIHSPDRTLISCGLDLAAFDAVPKQDRIYDVLWAGRAHRQKGVEDLLATLEFLAQRLKDFRVLFMGNLREPLEPEIKRRQLEKFVEFSGFVTGSQKIQLFKASRVFLMPSKHEGSPIVVSESIVAQTPVVAYNLPNYPQLYDGLIRTARPFELKAFQNLAETEILKMRAGNNYLEQTDLTQFREQNSLAAVQRRFLSALHRLP